MRFYAFCLDQPHMLRHAPPLQLLSSGNGAFPRTGAVLLPVNGAAAAHA
jgi:hypothetical protein